MSPLHLDAGLPMLFPVSETLFLPLSLTNTYSTCRFQHREGFSHLPTWGKSPLLTLQRHHVPVGMFHFWEPLITVVTPHRS